MPANTTLRLQMLLALLLVSALGTSAYVARRGYGLATGMATEGESVCSLTADVDCDAVLLSPYAKLFGTVSLAVVGTGFFAGLLAAWGLHGRAAVIPLTLLLGAYVGLSFPLVAHMLLAMRRVCLACLLTHVFGCAALVIALLVQRRSGEGPHTRNVAFGEPQRAAWRPTLAVAVLVLLVIAGGSLAEQYGIARFQYASKSAQYDALLTPELIHDLYSGEPVHQVPLRADDPMLGPANAPVTVVAFEDLQCPDCAKVSKVLREIEAAHRGKASMHPESCAAAWAAEAARQMGKFWPYQELIFAEQDRLPARPFTEWARRLGLNERELMQRMQAASSAKRVQQDIQAGLSAGVTGTPGILVDGRLIKTWKNEAVLKQIVAERVRASASSASRPRD